MGGKSDPSGLANPCRCRRASPANCPTLHSKACLTCSSSSFGAAVDLLPRLPRLPPRYIPPPSLQFLLRPLPPLPTPRNTAGTTHAGHYATGDVKCRDRARASHLSRRHASGQSAAPDCDGCLLIESKSTTTTRCTWPRAGTSRHKHTPRTIVNFELASSNPLSTPPTPTPPQWPTTSRNHQRASAAPPSPVRHSPTSLAMDARR